MAISTEGVMKMNKKLVGSLGLMLLFSLVTMHPVSADPPKGYEKGHGEGYEREHGRGYGMGMPGRHATTGHLLRGLLRSQKEMGLSEEQVGKIKALQLELDKTRIKTEADIMVAERELEALIEDGKADLSAIEAKVKQSEASQTSLRMAAIKARKDALAVLTPEQSERIKMVHDRMKSMKEGGMRGMRGEHRGGSPKAHPKKEDMKPQQ
jgi:protein CpxP